MGEYLRSTRLCSFENMNQVLVRAVRAHIEKYELGETERSVLKCCETTSVKQKRGLFGGKAEIILTGVVLTPEWLIWATSRNSEAPGVLSARLRDIHVQDYERSDMNKLVQDTGINISGLRTDAVDLGTSFIGFSSEPEAQDFRNFLRETLAKA